MRFQIWLLVIILAGPFVSMATADIRYDLHFSDGTRQTLDSVAKLLTTDRNRDEIKKLLNRDNRLQVVWRAGGQPQPQAPFLEMASGDLLPATVIGYQSAGPDGVPPAHFRVKPTHWPVTEAIELRIKASEVRRIVFQETRTLPFQTNQIVVGDGRVLMADRVSLQTDGIRALGNFGAGASRFATFSFSELDELHFESTSPAEAMASDGLYALAIEDEWLATIADAGGGRYSQTLSRSRVEKVREAARSTVYVNVAQIQPLWSLDAIWINVEEVSSIAYRRPNEMPLANLPVDEADQTKLLHAWKWQRNANVAGGRMAVKERGANTGFGVHANQSIAIELPPGAQKISGFVGIDQMVGRRGCAQTFIRRDSLNGKELWKSDFLRGGEPAAHFTNVDVNGAKQVVLVADAAASKFPSGADPLDIGDHVDWLAPVATVDLKAVHPQLPYADWVAALTSWKLPDNAEKRLKIVNFWNERLKQWRTALDIEHDGEFKEKPFSLTRNEKITLRNALVFGEVARSSDGQGSHSVYVLVDGEKINSSGNGGLSTTYLRKHRSSIRTWDLGDLVGGEAHEITMSFEHDTKKSSKQPDPLMFHEGSLRPLIHNLASTGEPISPTVSLESLSPTKTEGNREDMKFAAGTLTNGEPLLLHAYRLKKGIGVASGVTLHYDLKPDWKRFVAVIGLADGAKSIGPFQVFVDGEIVYESVESEDFGRTDPGEQIDVAIPADAKEMVLKLGGTESYGAWGFSGFLTE